MNKVLDLVEEPVYDHSVIFDSIRFSDPILVDSKLGDTNTGVPAHGAINLGWISRVLEDPMPQGQAAWGQRSLFSICITLTYYNKWQSRLDHGNTNTVARLSAER